MLNDLGRNFRTSTARLAARLPGTSLVFGPPRNAADTRDIADTSRLVRHSLIPARIATRPVAELVDPPLAQWMSQPASATIKEVYVADIPQGRYWGRYHGYILDRTDTLLTDLSPSFSTASVRHEGLDQIKLPPLCEVRGTAAVINTLFANNYHHWLLDTAPRLEWLRRAGFSLDAIDHFIFPKKMWPHNLQTLERLGLDPAKVICTHPQLHLRADRLLVPGPSEPSNQPLEYEYTPEGLDFIRETFLQNNPFLAQRQPARLVVSREKARARRLVQADKIHELLGAQGFEKVLLEDHSVQQQAAFFYHADCIVMPTGGNLANLVFCRPGTIVIELFSPSYTPPFSHALLSKIGLRYYGLVADKIARPSPDSREANEDIDIDPDRLAEVVRQALAKFAAI
jgi:capsular polysaccharide biosynthesis protein